MYRLFDSLESQAHLDQMPCYLLYCDGNGVVQWANQATLQWLEYTPETFFNLPLDRFQPANELNKEFLLNLQTQEALHNWPSKLLDQRGQTRNILINANLIKNRKPRYYCCVINDVTEFTKLEAQLRLSEAQAILSNKNKSLFFANMTHELRSPMNAVLGFSDHLARKAQKDQLSGRYLSAIDSIQRSGKRLLQLINDILDLSKLEACKLDLYISEFNASEVVDEVIEQLTPQAHSKQLLINSHMDSAIDIEADPKRYFQIITNLISNAIKYTSEGGLTVRLYTAKHAKMQDVVVFECEDTGVGLNPEACRQIFTPYTTIERQQNSANIQSTGLGLPITEEIVLMHNGVIDVDSTPRKGSLFRVTLPRYNFEKSALSELETDAVLELFNIGMGQVGLALSELIHGEVQLTVPTLRFISRYQLDKEFQSSLLNQHDCVITQQFEGDLQGTMMLMIPQPASQLIIRQMLNMSQEIDRHNNLHRDAIVEMGNIVINACLNSIANVLHCEASHQPPALREGNSYDLVQSVYGNNNGSNLLVLNMNLTLVDHGIDGNMNCLLNLHSLKAFKQKVQSFIHSFE